MKRKLIIIISIIIGIAIILAIGNRVEHATKIVELANNQVLVF